MDLLCLFFSFSMFSFIKLYFIDYAIKLVLILPLCPPPLGIPYSLRSSPHHCSCPWVMHISSLVSPFPILHFTSPWLFCNYLFVLLNPFTSSPILPHPPSNLFIFKLWHFNYDVSWSEPLCIHLVWDSLCFLDLHVYFLHQIREIFFHYFFFK